MKITLRIQKVSDAKDFFRILDNPNFRYFQTRPKKASDERKWIKNNPTKKSFHYSYTIRYQNKNIGGCGIRINQHRKHIGELGYFIDETHWGKGIAPKTKK